MVGWVLSTNLNVYNNLFYDTSWGQGTAAFCIGDGISANFYNNLLINCDEANGAVKYETSPPKQTFLFRILNNTFIQNGSFALYFTGSVAEYSRQYFWIVTNTVEIVAQNNIIYNASPSVNGNPMVLWSATNCPMNQFVLNYNFYWNTNNIARWWATGVPNGGDLTSLTKMRLAGYETNGLFGNPLFVNNSQTGNNIYLNDYHLQSGSRAIGAGVNLTGLNLPGLSNDRDGHSRPSSGPWTIGAYQSPAPLVSLVASPTSVTSGQYSTLTWSSVNATNLTLSGFGLVAPNGSTNVLPTQIITYITTYIATAIGTNGTFLASVSVTNLPSPPLMLRVIGYNSQ
jgi:hypothetical protein